MSNPSQLEASDDDAGNLAKTQYGDGSSPTSGNVDGPKWNLASVLMTAVAEPSDFIQQLAIQNQLLSCLKWLSEFQVLACIPLDGSISTEEIADLVCLPETQVARVVRMTATAGFLHEPQPGHFAHTALSTPFVTNLAYLDAAMFLAETAAPAALHMADATHKCYYGKKETAYSAAFPASQNFPSACVKRAKLQRQWLAYRQCVGDVDDDVTKLLARLKWRSLGNACIVDACAQSTDAAVALAETHPSLRFVVQLIDSRSDCSGHEDVFGGRISVQNRAPAAAQVVKNAAVYIVRISSQVAPLPAQILDELNAHVDVLRTNPSSTLVLALSVLPEPSDFGPVVEAKARMRDLYRFQLTNQYRIGLEDVLGIIQSASDGEGRLVVASTMRCTESPTVVLGIRYQGYQGRNLAAEQARLRI
ncbi:hypothetical protein ED733_001830 [Metarhizium rileyi]|uniref:Uncharacterized protein n=1 Tax=Metarhizium rileyi (strain RCEF 4871) TaxID=1649241 RepID=A0A5C6G4T3_METRR|nr:hypothetical protein ED733_001830 [Metarhizium rileyi]